MNAVELRHEIAASEILNSHTFGIVREDAGGPIEEVHGHQLVVSIALALAASGARGRIQGLKEAVDICHEENAFPSVAILRALDARILQAKKDANA